MLWDQKIVDPKAQKTYQGPNRDSPTPKRR